MTVQTLPAPSHAEQAVAPASPLREFWSYFSANRGAVAGLCFICLLLFCIVFANLISPYAYNAILIETQPRMVPPVWQEGGSWAHILGTDPIGRDMLSRLIYGSRYSIGIGAGVVVISVILGTTLGMIAGFVRGTTEIIILRSMDIILTLPSLLLAMVIVAILGEGIYPAVIAVAIVILPHYARLVRASVISETAKDYVTAAQLGGASRFRLMFKEVLPNCMAPLIVQASLGMSTAILNTAALGFLNLGAKPPLPEWGTMLADAREYIGGTAWWVVTLPGLAILITVIAFNLLGDGLRDALDPKLKS